MPSLLGRAEHQNKDGCSFASTEHKCKLVWGPPMDHGHASPCVSHPSKLLFGLGEGLSWDQPLKGKACLWRRKEVSHSREREYGERGRQRILRWAGNLLALPSPVLSGSETAGRKGPLISFLGKSEGSGQVWECAPRGAPERKSKAPNHFCKLPSHLKKILQIPSVLDTKGTLGSGDSALEISTF